MVKDCWPDIDGQCQREYRQVVCLSMLCPGCSKRVELGIAFDTGVSNIPEMSDCAIQCSHCKRWYEVDRLAKKGMVKGITSVRLSPSRVANNGPLEVDVSFEAANDGGP